MNTNNLLYMQQRGRASRARDAASPHGGVLSDPLGGKLYGASCEVEPLVFASPRGLVMCFFTGVNLGPGFMAMSTVKTLWAKHLRFVHFSVCVLCCYENILKK